MTKYICKCGEIRIVSTQTARAIECFNCDGAAIMEGYEPVENKPIAEYGQSKPKINKGGENDGDNGTRRQDEDVGNDGV